MSERICLNCDVSHAIGDCPGGPPAERPTAKSLYRQIVAAHEQWRTLGEDLQKEYRGDFHEYLAPWLAAVVAAERPPELEMRKALQHVADEIHGQVTVGTLRDEPLERRIYWTQVESVARDALRAGVAERPPEPDTGRLLAYDFCERIAKQVVPWEYVITESDVAEARAAWLEWKGSTQMPELPPTVWLNRQWLEQNPALQEASPDAVRYDAHAGVAERRDPQPEGESRPMTDSEARAYVEFRRSRYDGPAAAAYVAPYELHSRACREQAEDDAMGGEEPRCVCGAALRGERRDPPEPSEEAIDAGIRADDEYREGGNNSLRGHMKYILQAAYRIDRRGTGAEPTEDGWLRQKIGILRDVEDGRSPPMRVNRDLAPEWRENLERLRSALRAGGPPEEEKVARRIRSEVLNEVRVRWFKESAVGFAAYIEHECDTALRALSGGSPPAPHQETETK